MSKKVWIINKLIIIALSLCIGLIGLSGAGLIVAGIRAKKKQWKVWGLGYMTIGFAVLMFSPFSSFYLVIWFISIVHTVCIAGEYCMRLQVMQEAKGALEEKKLEVLEKKREKIYEELTGTKKENQEIENKEVMRKRKKLDVNTCMEIELSEIPGIGLILAKRIVDIRADKQFVSVEEFYKRLNIKEDRQRVISDYLFCSGVKNAEENINEDSQYDYVAVSEDAEKKTEKSSSLAGRKIDL